MHTLPRSLFLSLFLFIFIMDIHAQSGGRGTYDFLTIPYSARTTALGGDFLAIRDNDVTLVAANPSLITPAMNNNLGLGVVSVANAFTYGFATFAHNFEKVGAFAATMEYINYGDFQAADESGNKTGNFNAGEYALIVGWGRSLSPLFSIGANGKLIYSGLEDYNSFGFAVDVAGTYVSKSDLFSASLIAKNIGTQITTYTSGGREALPFEIQAGVSTKMKHIPLRFSFLYNHIERWDLSYYDPLDPENQVDPLTGTTKQKSGVSKFADNFMRHIVIGSELTIAKVLALRLGYNYQHRQEMQLPQHKGLSGFSLGVGLRVKMFSFNYARTTYMSGGVNPNHFTISADLGAFSKKESAPEKTE
ncbi:MAG: type IX secretion system protein PorQ [Syntrophothermus sp.]